MALRRLDKAELMKILDAHELWVRSKFQSGARANLREVDLSGTDLSHRNLSGAVFYRAKLKKADLTDTIFFGSRLGEADFAGAVLNDTVFRRADLRRVKGLDQIVHKGPITIGIDTMIRSKGLIPRRFIEGSGLPAESVDQLVEWSKQVGEKMVFSSVFISYGGPDEKFARHLHERLLGKGVQTFFFPEHAKPGEKLHREMREGINETDRLVLLCSQHSLIRKGVLNEIEEALQREAREGGTSIIIPIALDDYVYSDWAPERPDIAEAIRDRVVADFRAASNKESSFNSALDKLLQALRGDN